MRFFSAMELLCQAEWQTRVLDGGQTGFFLSVSFDV
ncbi:MAG: hypothetical protein RLZZ455_41 [Candidatus Parcubacteria bacterium]